MGMRQVPFGRRTARTCPVLAALTAGCALAFLAATSTSVRAVQAPELDQLLTLAAARVDTFGRSMANVIAQEDYQQVARDVPIITRRTRGDMAFIDVAGNGWWVAFRDVFEVDGQPVRDREERLSRLLATFSADSLDQAIAIADESARFNLSAFGVFVDRTINTPMATLMFLRAVNQSRSTFRLEGSEEIDGAACKWVAFTEESKPSLIESIRGAVRGRFCVEPQTGRVVQSVLQAEGALNRDLTRSVHAHITVRYAEEPQLRLWVPVRMDEVYEVNPGRRTINGRADYSTFRQFGVSTSETAR